MSDALPIVIGVAGRIGSGKTAIAKHLEHDFGFQYLRYSQVLAEWFKTDPADKMRLQDVGGGVMSGSEGQRELNRRLIMRIERCRDVVVDGLRHPIDHQSLHEAFGDRFSLVFVDTPDDVRFRRLLGRYRTREEFLEADSRSVEAHINSLRPLAARVLPGATSPEHLTSSLSSLVLDFRERMVA